MFLLRSPREQAMKNRSTILLLMGHASGRPKKTLSGRKNKRNKRLKLPMLKVVKVLPLKRSDISV